MMAYITETGLKSVYIQYMLFNVVFFQANEHINLFDELLLQRLNMTERLQ